MRTIKITEEVRLPGTNVILEKGDRVQVQSRNRRSGLQEDARKVVKDALEDNVGDDYGAGLDAGDDIMKAAKRESRVLDIKEFAQGVLESAEAYL